MTKSTDRASWPQAIGCYFGGTLLTSATWVAAMAMARGLADAGVGSLMVQLFGAGVVVFAAAVAVRLPRRARAMFVAGACTPIVLGVLFIAWVIWAFAHNFTF